MKNLSISKLQKSLLIIFAIFLFVSICAAVISPPAADVYAATEETPLSRYLYYSDLQYVNGVQGYIITSYQYHGDGTFGTADNPAVIPAQYNGYPILGIEAGVFGGAASINYIKFNTLEEGGGGDKAYPDELQSERAAAYDRLPADCKDMGVAIQDIGDFCFASSDLVQITLPESITSLGEGCFATCKSLTRVKSYHKAVASEETYTSMQVGENESLQACIHLKTIGSKCFIYDYQLKEFELPDDEREKNGLDSFDPVGETTFYPDGTGIYEIGDSAFHRVEINLESIDGVSYFVIPASLGNVIEQPFEVVWNEGANRIYGDYTTNDHDGNGLNVSVYCKGAPGTCECYPWGFSRTNVTYNTGATGYGYDSNTRWYYNSRRGILGPYNGASASVTVPISIGGHSFTKLAPGALNNNTSITTVTFATGWGDVGMTQLPTSCFKQSNYITSISGLPDTIEKIAAMSFEGCTRLNSITTTNHTGTGTGVINIPDQCSQIGFWAFNGCDAITTVNIWGAFDDQTFKISQSAFVTATSTPDIVFKNLTGDPRNIGNLHDRPEEYSVWETKTYPFGCINPGSEITFGSTTLQAAVRFNNIWDCIVLTEAVDNGAHGTVQLVRTNEANLKNNTSGTEEGSDWNYNAGSQSLTFPSKLVTGSKTYDVKIIGKPNGHNKGDRTIVISGSSGLGTTLKTLKFPEGVEETGYMLVTGTVKGTTTLTADGNAMKQTDGLIFPSTLKKIGDWSFYPGTIETYLQFPAGLEQVGLYAFRGCTILNTSLVYFGYCKTVFGTAYLDAKAPNLTDIYYLQYRTQESDNVFSRENGKYLKFTGKHSSSVAGAAGIKRGTTTPTVHYMDDYSPYVYEIGLPQESSATATDYEKYLPVLKHASNKGNMAYDMPTDDPVFAIPVEKYDSQGTFFGYGANLRFGVRMMNQLNRISNVELLNQMDGPVKIKQDDYGKLIQADGTEVTLLPKDTVGDPQDKNKDKGAAQDFYMLFWDEAPDSGTYSFQIFYENDALADAIKNNGSSNYDAGGEDGVKRFITQFTISIDIYASVHFQHGLTETITGENIPGDMVYDDTGRALLKVNKREYEQTMTGSLPEVTPTDKTGLVSTVNLPAPAFEHPSAEFIGWTMDSTVGGKVWVREPDKDSYIPIGQDFSITRDQLDKNDQVVLYSVFRLKLNTTTDYENRHWTYGDDPYRYFNQPRDGVSQGTFTMFRKDDAGIYRLENVVDITEGQFATAFNEYFNSGTHAGSWVIFAGDWSETFDNTTMDEAAFQTWVNGLTSTNSTWQISEFDVLRKKVTVTTRPQTITYGDYVYADKQAGYDDFGTVEDFLYGSAITTTEGLPAGQTPKDAYTLSISGKGDDDITPHVGQNLQFTVGIKIDATNGYQDYEFASADSAPTSKITVEPRPLALNVSLYRDISSLGIVTPEIDDQKNIMLTPTRIAGTDTYTWTYYGSTSYEHISVTTAAAQPVGGDLVLGDDVNEALASYVPDFKPNEVKAGSYDIYVLISKNPDAQINKDYEVTLINNNNPGAMQSDVGESKVSGYLAARVTINKLQITSPTFSDELYFGTRITSDTIGTHIAKHAEVVIPEGVNELPSECWTSERKNELLGKDSDDAVPNIYTMSAPEGSGTYFSDKTPPEGIEIDGDPKEYWFAGTYTAPFTFTDGTNYAWQDTLLTDRADENKLNQQFTIKPAELALSTSVNRNVFYNKTDYYAKFPQGNQQRAAGLVTVKIYSGHGSDAALAIWGAQGSGPAENGWSVRQFTMNGGVYTQLINAGTYTYRFALQGDGARNFVISTDFINSDESDAFDYSTSGVDPTFGTKNTWKNVSSNSAEIDFVINKARNKLVLTEALPTEGVYYDGTDKAAGFFGAHFKLENTIEGETFTAPEYNANENIHGYRVTYRVDTEKTGFGAVTAIDAGYYVLIVQLQGVDAINNIEFVAGDGYTLNTDTNATQITWSASWEGSAIAGYNGEEAPEGTVIAILPAELEVKLSAAAKDMVFRNSAYAPTDILSLEVVEGHGKNLLTTSDYNISIGKWTPNSSFEPNDHESELFHAGKYAFKLALSNDSVATTTRNYRFVAGTNYTVDADGDTDQKDSVTSNEDVLTVEKAGLKINTYTASGSSWTYNGAERKIPDLAGLTIGTPNPQNVMPSQSETDGYQWIITYKKPNVADDGSIVESLLNAGTYDIAFKLNGSAANDFAVDTSSLNYTINKATMVVGTPSSVVFDKVEHPVNVSVTDSIGNPVPNEEGANYSITYEEDQLGGHNAPYNARTYTVNIVFTEEALNNYTVAGIAGNKVTRNFVIEQATISVDWGALSCTFDGADHKKSLNSETHDVKLVNSLNPDVLPLYDKTNDYTQGENEFWLSSSYSGWYTGGDAATQYVHAGTYALTAHLKEGGNFKFSGGASETTTNFTISQYNLSDEGNRKLTFTKGEEAGGILRGGDSMYDGLAKTPLQEVCATNLAKSVMTDGENTYKILIADSDYNVVYSNNMNAGKNAKITINGLQDYTGTVTVTFEIAKRPLGTSNVEGSGDVSVLTLGEGENFGNNKDIENTAIGPFTYTGSPFDMSSTLTLNRGDDEYFIRRTSDYIVTYWQKTGESDYKWLGDGLGSNETAINAGTYYVVAKAKEDGNFTGAYVIEVIVNKAKISVAAFGTVIFDRALQVPNVRFVNSANAATVPADGDWGVYFAPRFTLQTFEMSRFDEAKGFIGLPSYADTYDVGVVLLGDAANNFEISGANEEETTLTPSTIFGSLTDKLAVATNNPTNTGNEITSEELNIKTLSGLSLTFGAGCYYQSTFEIEQLAISLLQKKTTAVFDYNLYKEQPEEDLLKGSDRGVNVGAKGRHTNDAVAIDFLNLRSTAKVNDVPYKLYIYKDGKLVAVFHYTTDQKEGNFVHLGECTPFCDGTGEYTDRHNHMHFTYADDGVVTFTAEAVRDHADDIQKLRNIFTYVGTLTLKLVLDNCNYDIDGGSFPEDEALRPSCTAGKADDGCHIMREFTFTITPATLNPYLFDKEDTAYTTDAEKQLTGADLQITYDGKSHALWVWFTNADNTGALPISRTPVFKEDDTFTDKNYYAQYGYDGWAGHEEGNSTKVGELTDGHKHVGTYSVVIKLKEGGNFQFSGGAYETTLTYSINALALSQDNVELELIANASQKSDAWTELLYNGDKFPYVTTAWEPVKGVKVKTLNDGTGRTLEAGEEVNINHSNNINVGNEDTIRGTVQISGVHNFSGSLTLHFDISPKSLGTGEVNEEGTKFTISEYKTFDNDSQIEETIASALSLTYNGLRQNGVATRLYNKVVEPMVSIAAGSDYIQNYYKLVSGDANSNEAVWEKIEQEAIVDAGIYRVTAKGQGNYSGLYIVQVEVAKASVSINPDFDHESPDALTFEYDAMRHTPTYAFYSAYTIPRTGEYSTDTKYNFGADEKNSTYAGLYSITITLTNSNYRWDTDETYWRTNCGAVLKWQEEAPASTEGAAVGIYADVAKDVPVVTIVYRINPATVNLNDFAHLTYKHAEYDLKDEAAVSFRNANVNNAALPVAYEVAYAVSAGPDNNALLGVNSKPLNAGNYDVTVTLNGDDDAINFRFGNQGIKADENNTVNQTKVFIIDPALVQLNEMASTTYNGKEQTPDVTFSLLNETDTLNDETANEEIAEKFSLQYRVNRSSAAFSEKKPVDANKYDVQVTLEKGNYAFNNRSDEQSSTGTFEILPLDINSVKEFKVEMPSKVYTGMTIENTISSVTVTPDGDITIIFKKGANTESGEVELTDDLFKIIGYLNNVNVGDANATISAGGNFTGTREVLGAFEIVARNVVVEIIDQTSPYGQSLALSNVENVGWRLVDPDKYSDHGVEWDWKADWDASESSSKHYIVYKNDSLNINLAIKDGHYNQKDGSLLVGTYAIVNSDDGSVHLESVNENYNVKFVGSWSGEGDNQKTAGTYEVTPREIVLTIGDLISEYGTYKQEDIENGSMLDKESLIKDSYNVSSYQGDAILSDDKDALLKGISLSVVHNDNWSAGTNKWLNVGKYAIVVKYVVGDTESTYYLASGTTDAGYTYNVGAQYKITLAGNFDGEDGEYGADSGVEQTSYKAHAGVFEVTPKSIIIEITHIEHEYDGQEPKQNEYSWGLKEGSVLAEGDEDSILGVKLSKNPGFDVGVYSITGTYTTTGSYIVNFENGINAVTITPRRITVQINDQSKTYDGEAVTLEQGEGTWEAKLDESSTYTPGDAIVNSDDLQITLLNTHISLNAGSYPIVATCANTNYQVMSWTGSWENKLSPGNNFDVIDGEAGTYTIDKCSVTVTIYSQSGVYGNNQHKGIDSTQYNAWVVKKGSTVYEGDNLGIAVTIVDANSYLSEKGKQLNAGWYAIEVTYNNGNYDVTFECQHNIKTDDNNVTAEDVNSHAISGSWNDEHTEYTVENGYRIYPRRLEITVANQEDDYKGTGVAPTVKQKAELSDAWRATNVLNGSMPPFVEGEEEDFRISLGVKPVESGKWNAGNYEIVGEVTNEGDKNNYVIDRIQNGTFTIKPLAVTVTVTTQSYAVYNGTDWAADFNTKSKTVETFANDYWSADGVLDDDQALFAKAIQLNLPGEAKAANVYSASAAWRDDADADIMTNYALSYEGGNKFTVNKRSLSVEIKDATSVYGENFAALTQGAITCTNDETDTHDQGIIGSDDLGIELLKNGGRDKGKYAITGNWNNNGNYEVTFTGSWNEDGSNKDHAGTYTITERKLTVHVNDQGGVFGGRTYTNLSQLQGTNEKDLGWYIVDFTDKTGISGDNLAAKTYIIPGDSLQIVLTLNNDTSSADYAGKCAIKAVCNNANYDVTFTGSWDGEGSYDDGTELKGKAGTFTVAKRQVTVKVLDQKRAYNGEALTMTGLNSKNRGWTEEVTNDDDNYTVTFVDSVDLGGGRKTAPEIKVSLSVEGAKNVGKYLIHIRITRDGTVIFNSSETELSDTVKLNEAGQLVVTTNEYEITVVGTQTRTDVASDDAKQVKVCGEYEITQKEVTLTIEDKMSTYGEDRATLTWRDLAGGIVSADSETIKEAITLSIQNMAENLRGETYLVAGTYHITAEVASNETSDNYKFSFVGTTGTEGYGIYTVGKRGIGLRVNDQSVVYGTDAKFAYTIVSLPGTTGAVILSCDEGLFEGVIKYEVLNQQLSNSSHLNVGTYPIWISLNTDESKAGDVKVITDNYEITFTGLWSGDAVTGPTTPGAAGTLTVTAKLITVTGITSESNVALTSEYGDAVPDDWSYSSDGAFEGDIVEVAYSLNASETANVGTYPVTVALARADESNDNANYTMAMARTVEYNITARRVKFVEPSVKEIVYGNTREYPEIVVERDGKEGEWNKYASGGDINDVKVDITVVGETLSTSGFLRVKMQSGEVIGYDITLSLSGVNASNYQITNASATFEQKLKVNKRPVTVTIDDQTSVYAEKEKPLTYKVEGEDAGEGIALAADGTGLAKGDDRSLLSITLTRQGLSEGQSDVDVYAITGTFNCPDYEVVFSGNWDKDGNTDGDSANDNHAGVYKITERNIRIEIYNQSAIYGESISVTSIQGTDWDVLDAAIVDGVQYYGLKPGDSLGIELQIVGKYDTDKYSVRPRGFYTIDFDEAKVNANYKVTLVREDMPTDEVAQRDYADDYQAIYSSDPAVKEFMWGGQYPISEKLRSLGSGMFFVTVREVNVHINNQNGIYGDEHKLVQTIEGDAPAYRIGLPAGSKATGDAFVDGLKVEFELVTTAYGSEDKSGQLSYAGEYPIYGKGMTATRKGVSLESTDEILRNYRIGFSGAWTGEEEYPSGSTYKNRVGVFTVNRRQVNVTVNDSTVTYGALDHYKNLEATDKRLDIFNQSSYTASATNSSGAAFVNGDLDVLALKLYINYHASDLSGGQALKVGSYMINVDYRSKSDNEDQQKIIDSYVITPQIGAKLIVERANITISILNGAATDKGTTYGDDLSEAEVTWNSVDNTNMYTVAGGFVTGDKLDFTLTSSTIALVKEGIYPAAGNYAIYATWQAESEIGDNANYNTPTWTGAFTKGIDPKDDHYAGTAGIYTVAKKGIEVTIDDAEAEYGESTDIEFSYKLPEGWAVAGDDESDLGIKLFTDAKAGSPVSATGYAIKGNATGANYDVTFKGSYIDDASGTLNIYPRKIVVVIRPQSSVYGTNPMASYETTKWFVVRDGKAVTSDTQGNESVWTSVFGEAKEKSMGELSITLTKGITYVDGSTWSNGNGQFVGKYAITGRCDNNNYDVVFAKWTTDDAEDYRDIVENTWGEYEITPLDVTITIKDREGVYGSILTDGVTQLRYNAKLVNTLNTAWTYGEASGTFTVGHEQYLAFYLRGDAEKGNIYAEVGEHRIEGVWAQGITESDADHYGIKKNYNVKFVDQAGEDSYGAFTVTPATIQQNNRTAEDGETFTGTLWNQTQLYRGEAVSYSLKVDAGYFFFAGDLSFGADDKGTVTYDAATVKYTDLKKDNQFVVEGEVSEDKLNITNYGVWTVDVTIKKANHKDATFTLTLTVVQADLTVTLKDGVKFEKTYGDYLADGQAAKGGARTFAQLQEDLKAWLFDTKVISKIDGAENIADDLESVIKTLLKITGDDAITVSIFTTTENTSSGGYLNAGNYIITFVVNGNIKIKFADTYSVVSVKQKELNMKWKPADGDLPNIQENYKDNASLFTYRYDGEDHNVTATPIDTLEGDLVANFGMQRYLIGKDKGETPQYELRLVGEYRVAVIVDSNPNTVGNRDISNYAIRSVDLYVTIVAVDITVLIKDRQCEYGEQDIDPNTEGAWEIISGAEALPAGEDLRIVLSLETFTSERRQSGTSRISGRSDNENYKVKFVGSFGETLEGRNDGNGGTYTVKQREIVVNVHDITVAYGTYTSEDLKDLNFVDLGDAAFTTSRPDDPAGYAVMSQNSAITIFPDDMEILAPSIKLDPASAKYTSTGYLKANAAGYKLLCGYNDKFNYHITFVLDNGDGYNVLDKYAKLIVDQKGLTVNIQTRSAVYGDERPTMPMNYTVAGFTSADEEWFNVNRDTERSFLQFTVRDATTGVEINKDVKFDPVGLYIIILEQDTSASHEIGSNYDITVMGEWNSEEYYERLNGKAGIYTVTPRTLTIMVHSASGEYGDTDVAERFMTDIISTQFAPGDTADSIKKMITYDTTDVFEEGRTKGIGVYKVNAVMNSANYTLDGTITANYEVLPREIDLKALALTSEYGDRHKDLVESKGYSVGWTATRSNGKTGNGIAYQDADEIVNAIKVSTDTSSTADAGEGYRVYIDTKTIALDKNYHVNAIIDGTLTIERRRITVRVRPQTGEYGEEHVLADEYDKDWTAERTNKTEFSDENVVVLPRDIYDITLGCPVDRTSPVGEYQISATFDNKNYIVAFVDGKYTVRPRDIFVRIENAAGEYGDNVSALTWSASRVGGNAIVNGDVLDITLRAAMEDDRFVDTTTFIGTYPIIATQSNNPNYNITFTGDYEGTLPDIRIGNAAGKYEVTKRRIIMTFDGESEYGDEIDPHSASYRADGKEGPAIVNGDDLGYTFDWIDDPYENKVNGYPAVGSYRLKVSKPTSPTAAQANYEVSDNVAEYSVYKVVPRKVTIRVKDGGRTYGDEFVEPNDDIMSWLEIRRTTLGRGGDPILNEDIKFFSLTVIDGDEATLTDGIPYFAGRYNYELIYTNDNPNYELSVVYGNYVVSPKPITVHVDDKTTNYGEDLLELTHSEIEGVLDGDELGFALSVLWGEGQDDLTWHNAGVYRIEASLTNANYALTVEGSLGDAGAYTILKVRNSWLKEYSVERLQQGYEPDPELLPEAEWGEVIIKYYYDKECTQELDRDIKDARMGTYYVKVTVLDTINWDGLESFYTVEVYNDFLNIGETDITLYVCLFASQFLIGLFALLFVGRRKKEKNK